MRSVNATFIAGLKKLNGMRASPVDVQRIELIRAQSVSALSDVASVERLILALGLNGEGLEEFPKEFHAYCSNGLLIWQYPNQFAPYLVALSKLNIRSYLEIGVRHGGTFIATVEYLEKFTPLDYAVAVDILPCPSMTEYEILNPHAKFHRANTQSQEFLNMLDRYGSFDLVLIDAFHEEAQCRKEFQAIQDKAQVIALHDIASTDYPGIATVWQEIKATGGYDCHEFTGQYDNVAQSYMGIGLAIDKNRGASVWKP